MNATKAKRRLAIAALAVLTAIALLVARHSPFRRSRPRPAPPPSAEHERPGEGIPEQVANGLTEEDLDPPLDWPEPVWPEPELRPPRPVRLPPPPLHTDAPAPCAETALAEPAPPTLLFDAEGEFAGFGARLLRERGRGVEIVFLASQDDASQDLAESALLAAQQVRLLFPHARFGAAAFDDHGAHAEPLGAPDEAWSGTLSAAPSPQAGSGSAGGAAAAFALASSLDWTPRAHAKVVILLRRVPDLAGTAMLVRNARAFSARTDARVLGYGIGESPPESEAAINLLLRTDAVHFTRMGEPTLLGRELLSALLGSEERDLIERILDAAKE